MNTLWANVWANSKLYLRTDCSFVGTVVTVSDSHTFPDGTRRKGVLVKFVDGTRDWLPREAVIVLYVTPDGG